MRDDELRDLRLLRPDAYVTRSPLWSGPDLVAFQAREPADFDWMERMILTHGYYEHEGVWDLALGFDKQAMAEIMAAFRPGRALEIGCATGTVLHYLAALGVPSEGIEISRMAVERAIPGVRDRIHHGDLLTLPLSGPFDLVYGLDVFEHLNPNRLAEYLAQAVALLGDGGYLYAALPAFGDDPVFGQIFPLYLREWHGDIAQDRSFRLLHTDGKGYPLNGHLIWADSRWWVTQFERHGLRRVEAVERAVHERYDHFFDGYATARKAFYVFAKNGRPESDQAVIYRLRSEPSAVLGEPMGPLPLGGHLLANDHVFAQGWHRLEGGAERRFRWSRRRAEIRLGGLAGRWLTCHAFTSHPEVGQRPVTARFVDRASGREVGRVILRSRDRVRVNLPLPPGEAVLEVQVDLPWVPKLVVDGSEDARELGIALEDVELHNEPLEASPAGARARWSGALTRLRALVRPPGRRGAERPPTR
ncbi:MAG TPA: methyltransferase domain-containing protein [Methylomirabilota bacterium]